MKFNFDELVKVPADYLFSRVSDFEDSLEQAKRRGINARRTDDLAETAAGMSWIADVKIRRRPREMQLELKEFEAPEGYKMQVSGTTLVTEVQVDCVALARNRSRLMVTVEVKPKNLRGRLLVQSLKLARGRIRRKGETGIQTYARQLESDYGR